MDTLVSGSADFGAATADGINAVADAINGTLVFTSPNATVLTVGPAAVVNITFTAAPMNDTSARVDGMNYTMDAGPAEASLNAVTGVFLWRAVNLSEMTNTGTEYKIVVEVTATAPGYISNQYALWLSFPIVPGCAGACQSGYQEPMGLVRGSCFVQSQGYCSLLAVWVS
jgi:hypothetical protein